MAAAMYCRCTCESGYNDGKEIDLVFDQDQTLYPLEVKLGATARRDWVRVFSVLERLGKPVGEGGSDLSLRRTHATDPPRDGNSGRCNLRSTCLRQKPFALRFSTGFFQC